MIPHVPAPHTHTYMSIHADIWLLWFMRKRCDVHRSFTTRKDHLYVRSTLFSYLQNFSYWLIVRIRKVCFLLWPTLYSIWWFFLLLRIVLHEFLRQLHRRNSYSWRSHSFDSLWNLPKCRSCYTGVRLWRKLNDCKSKRILKNVYILWLIL